MRGGVYRGVVAWMALALVPAGAAAPRTPTPAETAFERHVRPLLVEHCVRCHGPKKQKGSLRLDTRAGLLAGGEGGAVVKPGKPDASRLIQAVRRTGELRMPPRRKLSPTQIAILTAWVKAGAPWPADPTRKPEQAWKRHWAFQPVRNPTLPAVKHSAWTRTAIDRFVLAKLEAKGLAPSPEADRRTLLRRLSFDLLGLPPTPGEVSAFLADRRSDAYERLVDRLLASPHYGERWGRYWLDVARYADTKGYVFFQDTNFPWAYTYRDYVVRAFNEDLAYNTFILHQLAADRLPLGKDRRPLTALGFLTLGGRFMNNVQDILDDRIDVVTRGLLGLTVSCARCHDHKFDPVPTADYYSLYGVFASCVEPEVPPLFAAPPRTPAYAAFVKELTKREGAMNAFLRTKLNELTAGARTRVAEYLLAAHARRGQPSTADFMLIADGGDLNPTMLVRYQAYLERTARAHHRVWAPWHRLAALPEKDFADRGSTLIKSWSARRDGKHPLNPLVLRALANKPPRTLKEVAARYAEVLTATEKQWQQVRVRARGKPPARLADANREELRQVFHAPNAPANLRAEQISDLDLLPDRPSQSRLQALRKAVEQWRASGRGAPPRAMVLLDAASPVEPRVFRRGNPNNLGPRVPRRFLAALSRGERKPFRAGSGRLELARAIADRNNPLTARVLVNRVWQHHFGRGIVGTPSDFGLRSEPPTHPQLLDHLAGTFVNDGWSIKRLHRRILLSAVYRQQSLDRPSCRRIDPENALLWRMTRRRLDFEALRDALLCVAGRLDPTLGGPPVRDSLGAGRRRTLYGFLDRQHVPGLLRAFDFPSPDASSPRRDATTVPQQALFMMNNPFVLASANALLARPGVAAEKDIAGRVDRLYRLAYGRRPAAEEEALAREFVGKGGATEWRHYVQALLLANEFVFVD
jgi:mono/diheme cytochrome c family protein